MHEDLSFGAEFILTLRPKEESGKSMASISNQRDISILFICKKDNEYAQRAAAWLKQHFSRVTIFEGRRKDSLPESVLNWKGDLLISFISPWVYPVSLLQSARIAAINFHPGSPDYPGTGCTNFAIYEGADQYGITCHHMVAGVDAGQIIAVKEFPLKPDDTVLSVTEHCYELIESCFYEVMEQVQQGEPLPATDRRWTRKPFTRKQLNELCRITADMSEAEIEKRIKATTYKGPWAYTMIGNHKFVLQA